MPPNPVIRNIQFRQVRTGRQTEFRETIVTAEQPPERITAGNVQTGNSAVRTVQFLQQRTTGNVNLRQRIFRAAKRHQRRTSRQVDFFRAG